MTRNILRLIIVCVLLFIVNSNSFGMDAIAYNFYPDSYSGIDNPITVAFNGKVYLESWWFDEVVKNEYNATPDEKFILSFDTVNRNGSLDEILALWAPDEREEARQTFSDPITLSGSQGYFKLINNSAFLEKIAYGPYIIFLIQQSGPEIGDEITEVPIVLIDNNYYLTNKLKSDPLYVYMIEKMKKDYE